MLKGKSSEAVEKGRFQVYAITEIEEGLEILTGKKSGKRKKDGSYPQKQPERANRNPAASNECHSSGSGTIRKKKAKIIQGKK